MLGICEWLHSKSIRQDAAVSLVSLLYQTFYRERHFDERPHVRYLALLSLGLPVIAFLVSSGTSMLNACISLSAA